MLVDRSAVTTEFPAGAAARAVSPTENATVKLAVEYAAEASGMAVVSAAVSVADAVSAEAGVICDESVAV
jgi:hypothetical protein